jgi:PAS domain S-box-containing protein
MRNRRQRTVGKIPAERTPAPPDGRRSEERFRLLVESVIDYAILMLDPEGRVVSWNAGAERLKGYRASEIIGQHFSRFYPKEDVERHKPEYELQMAAADGRLEDEGWRVRKDGSIFWANVVITALRDESGTLHGFGKVTRDLTERKRAEEGIRQLNDELRRRTEELTSTNADLEAFSYSVAHDLRAPLRQVLGFSKILTEDYGPQLDPGARRCLDRVQSGAQQMGRLVDDLLNLAKVGRQPLSREITSLNVVLDAALPGACAGMLGPEH